MKAQGNPLHPPRLSQVRGLGPVVGAVLFFAAIAALGVAHVSLRLERLHLGYALSRAAERQTVLAEEQRRLRIEVAALKSPARILPAARERARLGPPSPARIREALP